MRSVSAKPYLLVAHSFCNPLPSGFRVKMSSQVKTMEQFKRGMKVGDKTAFDLETIFLRLLMVGQKRQLQLGPIFQYELCNIPPSLIDEYGCLRKGNKSILANRLGLKQVSAPNIDRVDIQQMLYRIVYPYGGDASDFSENIKPRVSCYCAGTEQVLVFDRYDNLSAKDHERMRCAGEGSTDYNLAANSPLPNRDVLIQHRS